jgi:hypothetical protein
MSENKELSFNEVLNNLTKISNTFSLPVYIPSLKENIEFRELNTRQQKKLLETLTDTSIYKTQFTKIFLEIIKENLIDKEFDINKFTIYDKIFIGLSLRSKISDTLNVIFNENPTYSEVIDLSIITSKIKEFLHPISEILSFNKNNTNIEVELSVPSIVLESKYETELTKTTKKIEDIKDVNDIGNVLSEAFVGEVSKFISKLSFDDNSIDFINLTVNQRIRLTELLTADLTQTILQKVSNWKNSLDNILTISSKDQKYTKTINIDNLLFLM